MSYLEGRPRTAFYVRKEPKSHGTAQWIEGTKNLKPGMPVVIVEDVITTGASTLRAIERARLHELDVIVSTGLGEFLDDDSLVRFYTNCHGHLRRGGVFVTSSMQADRIADYLMRQLAELNAHYRRGDELIRWLHSAGFYEVSARQDAVGLQTLVVARKVERRRSPRRQSDQ